MTRGRGWTVNDPQNPGRYYLQGRGLSVALAAAGASPIGQGIRAANDRRADFDRVIHQFADFFGVRF